MCRTRTPRCSPACGGVTALGAELRDFDDTAAVLGLCDLVITVDTAVAHLAGALGRPTWILLPFAPDWRWLLERDDSPWYPTARLYRQPAAGDWESVIARVRADLAGMRGRTWDADSSRGRGPAGEGDAVLAARRTLTAAGSPCPWPCAPRSP